MDKSKSHLLSDSLTWPDEIIGWGGLCLWAALLIYRYRHSKGLVWVVGVAVFVRVLFVIINTYFYTMQVDPFEQIAADLAVKGGSAVAEYFRFGYKTYISFCSVVYLIFGRNPLLLQIVNVAMAVHGILLLTKIVVSRAGIQTGLWIGTFLAIMPTSIVFGTVIIRDSLIIYLLVLSIWFLIGAYRSVFVSGIWLSGVCILGGLTLHVCGSVLTLFWVVVVFCLISHKIFRRKEKLSRRESGHLFAAVVVAGIGLFLIFPPAQAEILAETGVRRMLGMTSADHSGITTITLAGKKTRLAEARGAYLMELDNSSVSAKIKGIPQRATYFLFAPFPWEISNWKDFLGFFDSLIQLLIVFTIIWLIVARRFSVSFVIEASMYLMLVVGFSLAVSNYGTAARHRLKLLVPGVPILALVFQAGKSSRNNKRKSPSG